MKPKKYRLKERPIISYYENGPYTDKDKLSSWKGLNDDLKLMFQFNQSFEKTLTDILKSNQTHPAVRAFLREIMTPDWMS